jgi:hypothetical protein
VVVVEGGPFRWRGCGGGGGGSGLAAAVAIAIWRLAAVVIWLEGVPRVGGVRE